MKVPEPGTWHADPSHFRRVSRRDILRVGWLGGLGLSLGSFLKLEAAARVQCKPEDRTEGDLGDPYLSPGWLCPHGQL